VVLIIGNCEDRAGKKENFILGKKADMVTASTTLSCVDVT
jgi:hypothetical protein